MSSTTQPLDQKLDTNVQRILNTIEEFIYWLKTNELGLHLYQPYWSTTACYAAGKMVPIEKDTQVFETVLAHSKFYNADKPTEAVVLPPAVLDAEFSNCCSEVKLSHPLEPYDPYLILAYLIRLELLGARNVVPPTSSTKISQEFTLIGNKQFHLPKNTDQLKKVAIALAQKKPNYALDI